MTGLVTFRLGEREYATPLADVREVVRLTGLTDLPGMVPPLAGVLDLRGAALPVLDLRSTRDARGDVLVRGTSGGGCVGVAVDRVRAVLPSDALPESGCPADRDVLPEYVLGVLCGSAGPVFLVDLGRMVDSVRGGTQT